MSDFAAGRHTRSTPWKVGAYAVVMLVFLASLIAVFGNFGTIDTHSYRAVFDDGSGLKAGQNVRIAGVPQGKVTSVQLRPDAKVAVAFTVAKSRPLTVASRADIRYENLTGDRYLQVSQGDDTTAATLAPGSEIPESRTTAALDIDSLIGGLKPLFSTISGDDVNKLASSLIGVLQGQGQTVNLLLTHTGSVTNALADQDAVIGRVLTEFNSVMATVDRNRDALGTSLTDLQQLVARFAHRSDPIGGVVLRLQQATTDFGALTSNIRPDLANAVVGLDNLGNTLVDASAELRRVIAALPEAYKRLARMGAYGSVFQLYACWGTLRLTDPRGENVDIPLLNQTTGRCAP